MSLTDLPPELLLYLGESIIPDLADLNSLSQVDHRFRALFITPLYRRALTDNRSKAFKTAILCKRESLVRRLIHEASLIHNWSWAILQANWERDESSVLIRYLVARERHVDITQEGQYNGQDLLRNAIQDLDSVSLNIILEEHGTALARQAVTQGQNHIYHAVRNGHSDLVRPLLQHGFPIDAVGDDQRSPLIVATIRTNRNMIKDLLEAGASVALCDPTLNLTALGWAIISRADSKLITLLLEHGSDPNIPTQPYDTLLHMAIRTRCLEAIQSLLEAGVALPSPEIQDYLFGEVYIQGNTDLLKWLTSAHPSLVDRTDRPMPWGLIDRAVRDVRPNSPIPLPRLLREWEVDLNVLGGDYDETILMCVLRRRYAPIMGKVEILLRHGADPNVCGESQSPISLALSVPDGRGLDLIRLMHKYGLDFDRCALTDRELIILQALEEGADDLVILLTIMEI